MPPRRQTTPKKVPELADPPKRRAANVVACRRRLMIEIAELQDAGRGSPFITNAEQLLTRWWGTASWTARQQLLRSAAWMLQLESNRTRGQAPPV
jgi:hypothetical protein